MSDAVGVRRARRVAVAAVLALVIAVLTLSWAKWLPYAAKTRALAGTGVWPGSDILRVGEVHPGDPPSWSAAWSFTRAYASAIWPALVAALLISAALQTLVPRAWLLRVLNRPSRLGAALAGAAASTPSMMCTCCTAPVAVGLRRRGAGIAAVVAYWLGNPLLNPAVLVFLLFVAPWQWTVTRLAVGAVVVIGGACVVSLVADRGVPASAVPASAVPAPAAPAADPDPSAAGFGRALVRLLVTLVPEYALVVMLVGGFRGWLFPLGQGGLGTGVAVVLVAATVGTLMVIPTGGEIPIAQGAAVAGLSLGAVGALLITLPAVSLPGIAMVGRAFGWRVTAAAAGVTAAGGLLGAAVLALLPG
ncbi:permease [Mangrovihabitans endophyticus]|uniref:Permease n=1 Tax=Mangrovihabitans endophyticus TaxID=1751298 RepID=A0A8J3C049_9ACTN|nr:permease [Mangrovihabitans endophyticus]GGK99625.1 hypothetical protein GCM10012284_37520 [Mangrovihabitans endophyticus]